MESLLIPPSIVMIVYGVLAEVSLARLFAAGVFPELILAGLRPISAHRRLDYPLISLRRRTADSRAARAAFKPCCGCQLWAGTAFAKETQSERLSCKTIARVHGN